MKTSLTVLSLAVTLGCALNACRTPREPETIHANWEVLSPAALASSHGTIRFSTHVKPVLEAKCVVCHNKKALPRLSFETRKAVFTPSATGPRIVPGHPESSTLIIYGTKQHSLTMPPVGERLTEEEKRIFVAWVQQGAKWPTGDAGQLHPNSHVGPR